MFLLNTVVKKLSLLPQVSAASEEANLERIQKEKANKLRKFQKDVGKRVRTMQKLKQQEQLASSCRAVSLSKDY